MLILAILLVSALSRRRGVYMRLRLPELLEERGVTAYAVAKASGGRISQSAIHALVRERGHFERIAARHLEALCEVLQVSPNDLIERKRGARWTRGTRRSEQG